MARLLVKGKTSKRSRPIKSKRKRTLNSQEPDRMAQALNELAEGKLSLRQVSRAWGIPKSTLQRRVTGKVTHCEHASGRHPALPNDVENDLCSYLKDLFKHGFP
jgi:hypothetical protein